MDRINFRLAGFPGQLFETQQAHRILVDTTVRGTSRKTKHSFALVRDPYPIASPWRRLAPWSITSCRSMDQGNDDLQTVDLHPPGDSSLVTPVHSLPQRLGSRERGIGKDGLTTNASRCCFHMPYSSCISLQDSGVIWPWSSGDRDQY